MISANDLEGTFMHELGHALRLAHSPYHPNSNYQPNHISVMNYNYQNTPGFLSYASDLDSDEQVRPSLRWLGEEVTEATQESECCCHGEECEAEPGDDDLLPQCCEFWCGALDPQLGICVSCEAVWLPGVNQCLSLVTHTPEAQFAVVPGASESECCCEESGCVVELYLSAPDWCPPPHYTVEESPGSYSCEICNATWYDGACYYGGLDDRTGIGANQNQTTHELVLASTNYCLSRGSSILSKAPSESFLFNIDWNSSMSLATSAAPPNLSARNLYSCLEPGVPYGTVVPSPFEAVAPLDEWGFIADAMASEQWGIQGLGLPAFCDTTFGCAAEYDCIQGWCLPAEVAPPPECVPSCTDAPCGE